MSKSVSWSSFALALVLVGAVACAGDDDSSPPISELPDAGQAPDTPAEGEGLGRACVPGDATSCPSGYQCVGFADATASGPFCTQQCTPSSTGDSCAGQTRYSGPGLAACVIGADTNGDQQVDVNLCGVVCEAPVEICPGCNSTCPGSMQCNQVIPTNNGVMAKLCF